MILALEATDTAIWVPRLQIFRTCPTLPGVASIAQIPLMFVLRTKDSLTMPVLLLRSVILGLALEVFAMGTPKGLLVALFLTTLTPTLI
jgi:hypothetical protein